MIEEIGEEGYKHLRKTLKLGDIIENGYASNDNPRRISIVVKSREYTINCTDGKNDFWDLFFDQHAKIKIHGSVLKDNYEDLIKALK